MPESHHPELKILRRRDLEARLGLSRSTIYDKINPKSKRYDSSFPRPIRLTGAAVGWLQHEVDAYLSRLVEQSRAGVL